MGGTISVPPIFIAMPATAPAPSQGPGSPGSPSEKSSGGSCGERGTSPRFPQENQQKQPFFRDAPLPGLFRAVLVPAHGEKGRQVDGGQIQRQQARWCYNAFHPVLPPPFPLRPLSWRKSSRLSRVLFPPFPAKALVKYRQWRYNTFTFEITP